MGRTDSKNEKGWLGKVKRTDPKKWEVLTRKMSRTDLKSGKDSFEKWEELYRNWIGLTLNMEYLSQNRESPIQKHDRSDSKKENVVDTSQSS